MFHEENLNTSLFCHLFTHAEGAARQLYTWLRETPGKGLSVDSCDFVLSMSTARGKSVFVCDCTEMGALDKDSIIRLLSHIAVSKFPDFFESGDRRHALKPQFHILYHDPDDTSKHEPLVVLIRYVNMNVVCSVYLQNIAAMSERKLARCPFLKDYFSFRHHLMDQYSCCSSGPTAIMYAMAEMQEDSCLMPYFAKYLLQVVDICLSEIDMGLFHEHWFAKSLRLGTMYGQLTAMELKGMPLEEAVDELLKKAEYAGLDRAVILNDYRLIRRNIADGLFEQDIR